MKLKLLIIILAITTIAHSQDIVSSIKKDVTQEKIETHIRFLASDELMGRETGSPGIDIAAAYISAYFKAVGVKVLPGMESYYQSVPFYRINAPKQGIITIGGYNFPVNSGFASNYRNQSDIKTKSIFLNYGMEADLENVNLKGKVAIILAGEPEGTPRSALSEAANQKKIGKLKELGASAVVILWHFQQVPWENVVRYINDDKLSTKKPQDNEGIPYFFIDAKDKKFLEGLNRSKSEKVSISYGGRELEEINSYNVVGYIEGTENKDKFLLLGAHYDHVGGQISESGEDLIYNGARDNAVGTSAVMMAGEYFAKHKPKNSVILALWTAEEKGLIGSRYFVENSPVELNNIYYNLNIDNGGYNDTTIVTVIGLHRTHAEDAIKEASEAFGVTAISDPAPEQNLFDRSDNVNFARKGIPSPTYSLGFTSFDAEIMKYYHQVTDEAESINFLYVTKYTRGYVYSSYKIANNLTETFWKEGDKYEEAGKSLYGSE